MLINCALEPSVRKGSPLASLADKGQARDRKGDSLPKGHTAERCQITEFLWEDGKVRGRRGRKLANYAQIQEHAVKKKNLEGLWD